MGKLHNEGTDKEQMFWEGGEQEKGGESRSLTAEMAPGGRRRAVAATSQLFPDSLPPSWWVTPPSISEHG